MGEIEVCARRSENGRFGIADARPANQPIGEHSHDGGRFARFTVHMKIDVRLAQQRPDAVCVVSPKLRCPLGHCSDYVGCCGTRSSQAPSPVGYDKDRPALHRDDGGAVMPHTPAARDNYALETFHARTNSQGQE